MQGYMYRDLKPENILISAQGHIRLSDFDLVRPIETSAKIASAADDGAAQTYLHSSDRAMSFVGTAEYVAPEVVQRRPYQLAAEWWSLGILAYEMMSGYTPFVGQTTAATFRRILYAQLVFRDDVVLTRDCKDFIMKCLERSPSNRLGCRRGAAELKVHAWTRHVQWALLANTERPPYIPNMPLLPEAPEGADTEGNPVVADRYRLFGQHFDRRNKGGSGTKESNTGGDSADDVAVSDTDADPFAEFDWINPCE